MKEVNETHVVKIRLSQTNRNTEPFDVMMVLCIKSILPCPQLFMTCCPEGSTMKHTVLFISCAGLNFTHLTMKITTATSTFKYTLQHQVR